MDTLFNVEDEVQAALNELGILTKIDEMDDFMNQNELKVTITNENAVVTGLVTYTCTVKDKNNNNLPGRVVEWYKGTTLLGIDATDSNGVSTFSHRVTEADIYDVHAVVRGTHAGDDIRMFVKDKDNLLNFNQWSCGDYNKNTNGFNISNSVATLSDNAINGDYSIHLVRSTSQTGNGYALIYLPLTESDIGKTVYISADIYSPNNSLDLQVNSNGYATTNIPQNESYQTYTVSKEIVTASTSVLINLKSSTDELDVFVDNIKCFIQ